MPNFSGHIDNVSDRRVISQTPTNSESGYRDYLIVSLEQERKKLETTTKKLQLMKEEKEQLEREVERNEQSRRYTKSLLRNLIELEKYAHSEKNIIKSAYKQVVYDIRRINDMPFDFQYIRVSNINCNLFYYSLVVLLFLILWILNCWSYLFYMTSITGLYIRTTLIQMNLTKNIKEEYKTVGDNCRLIENSIKSIKDTQDFLDEYIENL